MNYRSIHFAVVKKWGKANHCDLCGANRNPFNKKRFFSWSNKDHKYTLRKRDWWQLCYRCHKEYDYKKFGHIPWNKGYKKRADRQCKQCKKMFDPPKETSQFCSKHCAMKARYS